MNKISIIFGLGFQGNKYVDFFLTRGYIIDGVTKTGENKNNINGLRKIYKSSNVLKQNIEFFNKYNILIIAISPYFEQENIIGFLLKIGVKTKVIIEKPISYNLSLLEELKYKDNYFYFIDELVLNSLYKKILAKILVFNIKIKLFDKKRDNYIHILEHVLAGFLLRNNFNSLIENNRIFFSKTNKYKNDLVYNIIFGNKVIISYNKGDIRLNNILIKKLFFYNSLEFILSINNKQNRLLKLNFIKLRKYLNNLK